MKGLTLRHPWAFSVAYLGKPLENREWDDRLADLMGLPQLIGETIAIHGGAAPQRPKSGKHWQQLAPSNLWRQHCEDLQAVHQILDGDLPDAAAQFLARAGITTLTPEAFILPGIVAVATISGTTRASRDRWAAQGQLHILLSEVIALPQPVQCSGAQGFWTLPEVIETEVRRQYRSAIDARPPQHGHLTAQEWLA